MATGDRPKRILAGTRRSRRASAILDLIDRETRMSGNELPQDFFVWWDVGGTSRGIRPTKEWLEEAMTEKLARDLGTFSVDVQVRCVEANRGGS